MLSVVVLAREAYFTFPTTQFENLSWLYWFG
jgi:hypothetical protein